MALDNGIIPIAIQRKSIHVRCSYAFTIIETFVSIRIRIRIHHAHTHTVICQQTNEKIFNVIINDPMLLDFECLCMCMQCKLYIDDFIRIDNCRFSFLGEPNDFRTRKKRWIHTENTLLWSHTKNPFFQVDTLFQHRTWHISSQPFVSSVFLENSWNNLQLYLIASLLA